jgi:hypothetical protein
MFVFLALLTLGGLLASYAGKYIIDWTNAGEPPKPAAVVDPVKVQQLPELLGVSTALLPAENGLPTPV